MVDQNGACLPPGKEGELMVFSPVRMLGYLKMDKESEEYFDEEGFARTGDLATYDKDGKVTIVGRLKDQIT